MQIGGVYTKDYVLNKVTEEFIFCYYLKINNITEKVFSPFRRDTTPSGSFYVSYNKIRFNDFGTFDGDCFDLVARLNNINIRAKGGFPKVLNIIVKDLRLDNKKDIITLDQNYTIENAKFDYNLCDFNIIDINFWKLLNVNIDLLKTNRVFRLYNFFINDYPVYRYDVNNLAYIFLIGKKDNEIIFQAYFPFKNKSMRYINNKSSLKGLDLIMDNEDLIITKSYKDLLVLKSFGENVICTSNETKIIQPEEFSYIKEKIQNNKIYTLFDNDYTGKRFTIIHKQKYNTVPLLLKDTKDISDYILKFGYEKTKNLISEYRKQRYKIR
jgi:hypothetical protein